MKKTLSILTITALVTACATPTVVQETQVSDESLSCTQLKLAMAEAKRFETDAREERTVTGTNVAAAIFFWPGLLATYANTGDAIEAARNRNVHLTKISDRKGCSAEANTSVPTAELERLKQMRAQGLINEEEYALARKKALGI